MFLKRMMFLIILAAVFALTFATVKAFADRYSCSYEDGCNGPYSTNGHSIYYVNEYRCALCDKWIGDELDSSSPTNGSCEIEAIDTIKTICDACTPVPLYHWDPYYGYVYYVIAPPNENELPTRDVTLPQWHQQWSKGMQAFLPPARVGNEENVLIDEASRPTNTVPTKDLQKRPSTDDDICLESWDAWYHGNEPPCEELPEDLKWQIEGNCLTIPLL